MGGFASLTFALGWRTVASALTTVDAGRSGADDGEPAAIAAARARLRVPDRCGHAGAVQHQGTFEVQGRRAVVGVRADGAKDNQTIGTISLAGSIVGIGGQVLLSRPVDDGFALVKVPNVKGCARAREQSGGGTDGTERIAVRAGPAFVLVEPDRHRPGRCAGGRQAREVSQDIAVPYRGGAVVTFEAKRHSGGDRPPRGRRRAPSYGTLSIDVAGASSSPLNAAGDFYFEDLPPGDHPGVATWEGRSCRATVRMPDKASPMMDIGAVACVEEAK